MSCPRFILKFTSPHYTTLPLPHLTLNHLSHRDLVSPNLLAHHRTETGSNVETNVSNNDYIINSFKSLET